MSPPLRPRSDQSPSDRKPSDEITVTPPSVGGETEPRPSTSAASRLPKLLPAAFGRYELRKLLGKGGMGVVYLAHDKQLDRAVALKIPLFGPQDGPELLERFYREARAAATVRHPNVCALFDIGEIDGVPFLTMAFIEGKPLGDFVASQPITPRQAAVLVRKLALALQEAHKVGVIHRDLKPGNVMIDRRGEPQIMDFGLARRTENKEVRLTQEGATLGTPAYMPPEQVSGKIDAMGPTCDIYSLGVILYELLARRLPFEGDVMQVLAQVLMDEPARPSKYSAGIDAQLENVCLKAMAKSPSDRYQSMLEFGVALQEYLRGNSSAATPQAPAAPQTPAKPVKQEPEVRAVAVDGARPPASSAPADRVSRKRRKPSARKRVPIWPLVAIGIGVVLILGLWAAGAFKSKSRNATTVANNAPPPSAAPQSTQIGRETPSMPQQSRPTQPAKIDAPPEKANDFISIFNNKNSDDWVIDKGKPDQWTFEGATWVGRSDDYKSRSYLLSKRTYSDFTLRCEFLVEPGGFGAVVLRANLDEQLPTAGPGSKLLADHPCVRLADPAKFPGFEPGTSSWLIDDSINGKPSRRPEISLGGWHSLEITLRGNHGVALIDGQEIFDYQPTTSPPDMVPALMRSSGRVGLLVHTGTVRFRSIIIKELRAAEKPVIKDDEFVSLFNGTTLDGWKADQRGPQYHGEDKGWSVEGGDLVVRAQDPTERACLLTDRLFGDFRLRLDFNLSEHASTGIALRAFRREMYSIPETSEHPLLKLVDGSVAGKETGVMHRILGSETAPPNQPANLRSAGTWNHLEVECRGRSLRAWVNEQEIVSTTLAADARLPDGTVPALNRRKGRIGFQKNLGTVRFRNISILEYPPEVPIGSGPKPATSFPAVVPERDLGKWKVADGCLELPSMTIRDWITFGDKNWTDYDYEVEFQRLRGGGQLCLAFRLDWQNNVAVHPARACIYSLADGAGGGTAWQEFISWVDVGWRHNPDFRPKVPLPANSWNHARVRVRGNHVDCFLNGQKQFGFTIDIPAGGVGLFCMGQAVRVRNIKVTDPRGKVLLEGLPDMESTWAGR